MNLSMYNRLKLVRSEKLYKVSGSWKMSSKENTIKKPSNWEATFKVTFKIVFPLPIVSLFYIFSHVETEDYYPRPGCHLSPLGIGKQLGW